MRSVSDDVRIIVSFFLAFATLRIAFIMRVETMGSREFKMGRTAQSQTVMTLSFP